MYKQQNMLPTFFYKKDSNQNLHISRQAKHAWYDLNLEEPPIVLEGFYCLYVVGNQIASKTFNICRCSAFAMICHWTKHSNWRISQRNPTEFNTNEGYEITPTIWLWCKKKPQFQPWKSCIDLTISMKSWINTHINSPLLLKSYFQKTFLS